MSRTTPLRFRRTRWACVGLALLFGFVASAMEPKPPAWGVVEIPKARTSIYIGSVTLLVPTLTRDGQSYRGPYEAKVFPFAFYNEAGTLTVHVSDEQLAALARGEPIEFTGLAVTTKGSDRRVVGKATPIDATHGTLKVRVHARGVDLIFNTSYRFAEK